MEIVIDIPEYAYRQIRNWGVPTDELRRKIYDIIDNGTPLPKHHGRLIYEPTKEEIEKTVGGQSDFAECIRDSVKAVFDNAPTIIEADKDGEEE